MQFRVADTFTDSLAKLTGDEQKAVKTAAFGLQNRHRRSARRVQVLGGVQGGQPGDRRAVLIGPAP